MVIAEGFFCVHAGCILGNQLARWSNRFFNAADLQFSNSVP
ncbi:hypothetical protein QNM99_17025 [Pseudomonas sp. PCH446]